MEAVNVFCTGLIDRDIAQTLLCQGFKRVSDAMNFYRRAIHSKRAVLGDQIPPRPSSPRICSVSEDLPEVRINKVDVGRNSANAIADLQVAMARMRSENLANRKLILSKLDELCNLMKGRPTPGSDDRRHHAQTFGKVRDDRRLGSENTSSQSFNEGRFRSSSRSPGRHDRGQDKMSRGRTSSPARANTERSCYKCGGRGHFQDVCPSTEIKSVGFADTNPLQRDQDFIVSLKRECEENPGPFPSPPSLPQALGGTA